MILVVLDVLCFFLLISVFLCLFLFSRQFIFLVVGALGRFLGVGNGIIIIFNYFLGGGAVGEVSNG
jgi:hypothetical protein